MNDISSIRTHGSRNFHDLTPYIEIRDCVSRIVSLVSHFFVSIVSQIVRFCNYIRSRDPVLEAAARPLLTPEMGYGDRLLILRALAPILPENREFIVAQSLRLITPETSGMDKFEILFALAGISEQKIEQAITSAMGLITPWMDVQIKMCILRELSEIRSEEIAHVAVQVQKLLQPAMQRDDIWGIIRGVAGVPRQEREDVVDQALRLDHLLPLGGVWRRAILESLAKVSAQEREYIVTQAQRLMTPELSDWDKTSIIQTATRVPQFQDALERAERLCSPAMAISIKRSILWAVAKLPPQEREPVVTLALNLVYWSDGGAGPEERRLILEAVIAIPQQERESAIEQTERLCSPGMDISTVRSILSSVMKAVPQEREQVVTLALELVRQVWGVNSEDKRLALEAIIAIPQQEREQVITHVQSLIRLGMRALDTRKIFEAVVKIPQQERDNIIDQAERFIIWDMCGGARKRIIEALAFPDDLDLEIEHVNEQALTLIPEGVWIPLGGGVRVAGVFERNTIKTILTMIPREQRERAVVGALRVDIQQRRDEVRDFSLQVNPLQIPFLNLVRFDLAQIQDFVPQLLALPQVLQPDQEANFAIGVHDQGRDETTRAALELLRAHQGEMSDEAMEAAVAAFVKYFNDAPLSDLQKKLALFALYAEKKENENWGPLIDPEHEFSIHGLLISGPELIGRLWRFSSNLNDEREVQSAKQSMIVALSRSYYEDGTRICNQGKTQQLVLAVLQGRLAEVEIDKVDVPVSNDVIVKLFFLPESRQNIHTRADLLAEAHAFLEENPGVNREPFLQSMNTYADRTFGV